MLQRQLQIWSERLLNYFTEQAVDEIDTEETASGWSVLVRHRSKTSVTICSLRFDTESCLKGGCGQSPAQAMGTNSNETSKPASVTLPLSSVIVSHWLMMSLAEYSYLHICKTTRVP